MQKCAFIFHRLQLYRCQFPVFVRAYVEFGIFLPVGSGVIYLPISSISIAIGETTSESIPQRRRVRLSANSGFTTDSTALATAMAFAGSIFLYPVSSGFCLHAEKNTAYIQSDTNNSLLASKAIICLVIDV